MYKKNYSFIIIACTVIYATVSLSLNKLYFNNSDGIKSIHVLDKIKKINLIGIIKPSEKRPNVLYGEVRQSSDITIQNSNLPNENSEQNNDIPTFNQSEARTFNKLTSSDRDIILSVAKRLSPIDYAKINEYIKNEDKEDIKSALYLLRDRLSDKEYGKIKDIESKFMQK